LHFMNDTPPYEELRKKVESLEGAVRQHLEDKKKLNEQVQAWHDTVDAFNAAVWIIDKTFIVQYTNTITTKMFKCDENQILGKHCWEIVHGTDEPIPDCPVSHVKESLKRESTEIYFDNRWLEVVVDPILNPMGAFSKAVLIITDISERKRTEKRLERNEAILNSAQQLTKIGGWEYDARLHKMYWTDELYRLHGFEPQQFEYGSDKHIEFSMNCYPPKNRKIIRAAFNRCIQDGTPYDLESQFTKATGERIWVRTAAIPKYVDGQIVKIIGNLMDITDRKKAEARALAESERSRMFFSSVEDAIFVHPLKMEGFAPFVEVNDIACKRYGYTHTEFLTLSAPDITRKSDSLSHRRASHRKKLLEVGHLVFEAVHIKKSGEEFPVEINSNIISQGGEPYILAVVRDITERKKAEKERERLIRELKQSLSRVKELSGLLPICASCKKIRDDKGYWRQIEAYISSHSKAEFSHSICPDCMKKLYPDFVKLKDGK